MCIGFGLESIRISADGICFYSREVIRLGVGMLSGEFLERHECISKFFVFSFTRNMQAVICGLHNYLKEFTDIKIHLGKEGVQYIPAMNKKENI